MTADVLILDARWKFSDRGEFFVNGSIAQSEAMFNAITLQPFADVPINLIDPDDDPGGLPGPGEDTGSALRFHDYDFSQVNTYSDLEYTELRASVGVNYDITDAIGLFGALTYYDLQDDRPYLQDATGSVELVSGGLTWSF